MKNCPMIYDVEDIQKEVEDIVIKTMIYNIDVSGKKFKYVEKVLVNNNFIKIIMSDGVELNRLHVVVKNHYIKIINTKHCIIKTSKGERIRISLECNNCVILMETDDIFDVEKLRKSGNHVILT